MLYCYHITLLGDFLETFGTDDMGSNLGTIQWKWRKSNLTLFLRWLEIVSKPSI